MTNSLSTKHGFSLVVLAAIALLPACTQPQADTNTTAAKTIKIDGSSTVYPISDAIAKEYSRSNSKVDVDVKFSGTSGGFNKFCTGETDISNASRPILLQEAKVCANSGVGFIEIPIAFDALTIAVNPKNDWAKDITIAELTKIWEPLAEDKIKNWNQIRASYPNKPLTLFGAGKDSGTFDYFNEVTTGNPEASRNDYTDSENDNVLVQGIEKDSNALGYIPFAYFEASQNRLKALAVDSGKGAVLPSREAVASATYQPFSRPLFIYVNSKTAQDNPELKAFVEYYLTHAGRVSQTVGYVALPAEAYRLATIQFTRGEIGTVFEGVPQPNVTISELLRRQAVFQLSENEKADAKK
ncbi:PstS family phosphate ABC transporter substrate-binding protein [Phormidium sp. CLA17]|uniref:PstS family phosphate ABC transporter substrate-binding protein n=1 Tax=Leptolyngbya sp. Cla-17 TaxID=2803751 RepID=UPI001491512A|nr:PstS family phosphate ABC transporter substrate-binding protein [Leptolyngbya sp. Cla-17]MBM0740578.1 PstS family phosphate ABC transporter substrate-binding protein [Leptolyngbya sp. Cla-17]